MPTQDELLNPNQASKEYELLKCNPVFSYHEENPLVRQRDIGLNFFNEIVEIIKLVPRKMHIEIPYDKTDIKNYPIKVTTVHNNE